MRVVDAVRREVRLLVVGALLSTSGREVAKTTSAFASSACSIAATGCRRGAGSRTTRRCSSTRPTTRRGCRRMPRSWAGRSRAGTRASPGAGADRRAWRAGSAVRRDARGRVRERQHQGV
jgi:hypothetical protein